jgi:SAM-dependent methyltransferase
MPNHAASDDEYGAIADLYDFVGPYRERQDDAFFVEAAKEAGGPVLELGCGTGRIVIPTARAGVEVVGLDLSPGMLAACRRRLREESGEVQARVELVQGDMRDFNLARMFPLVTVPFRPFQHLITVDEQRACLAGIHRHLTSTGRLILDLFNPSLDALANRREGEEVGDEAPFTMADGRQVVRRFKIVAHDRANQTNHIEMVYYITHPDGREEHVAHAFAMRYLFRFEAEHLLARCGFEVEHLYAGYDKSAYGSQYPGELIFVARKAA